MIRLKQTVVLLSLIFTGLQAGEYADAFLLASLYPHVQSLGNSTVGAVVNNGHALNNPAGFANSSSAQVSLVYEQFNGLSNSFGLEVKTPIRQYYDLGFTLIHNSVDDLFYRPNLSALTPTVRRDSVLALAGENGDIIGYREDAFFISLAREYEFELNLGWKFFKIPVRLPIGVSVKYLDKLLIENRGLGTGIDLGAQMFFNLADMNRLLMNTSFSLGLVISDLLNSPVYWSTQHQDAIKRNITAGYTVSQQIEKYATELTFSWGTQTRYKDSRQYGLELKVKDMLFIRGGYDGFTPSFGLGIALKKFIIGYTFSQHELADMQKIAINYHF